jgi:hypothetical protein
VADSSDTQKEVGYSMVVNGNQLLAHVSTVVDFLRLMSWADQISFRNFCEYLLPYNSLSYGNDDLMQYYRDSKFQENDSAILSMPLVEAAETARQMADSTILQYHNAPSNALFWLRNHSGGKEERIFTYENGKQVWW